MDDADRVQNIVHTGNYTNHTFDIVSLKNKGFEDLVQRWKSLEKLVAQEQEALEVFVKNTTATIESMEKEIGQLRTEIGKRLGLVKEVQPTSTSIVIERKLRVRVNNRTEQLLEAVKVYGPLTTRELAEKVKADRHIVDTAVSRLIKNKLLIRNNGLLELA